MKITKAQIEEIKDVKMKVKKLDNEIKRLKAEVQLAYQSNNIPKAENIEDWIKRFYDSIHNKVLIQSRSMKIGYNTMVDLIYDTEHTIEVLNSQG